MGYKKTTNLIGIKANDSLTGIEIINVNPFAQDQNINPLQIGKFVAWYSAGFILQAALASKLDIDPSEIELAPIQKSPQDNICVPELFLSDKLPNGSGHVNYLKENLTEIIKDLLNSENTFTDNLLKNDRSIKYFYNQQYHPVLYAPLGLSLLRAMFDCNHTCGANDDIDFEELKVIFDKMKEAGEIFIKVVKKQTNQPVELKFTYGNNVPYFILNNNAYVIVHPLWNNEYDGDSIFSKKNFIEGNQKNIIYIDFYNVWQRPLWTYHQYFNN